MAFQNKDANQAESKVAKLIYRGDESKNKRNKGTLNDVEEVDSGDDDFGEDGTPDDFKQKMDLLDGSDLEATKQKKKK